MALSSGWHLVLPLFFRLLVSLANGQRRRGGRGEERLASPGPGRSRRTVKCQVGLTLAVFIALASGQAAAQDSGLARAQSLSREAIQLYRAGRYQDAVPLAEEALSIREQALGPDDPDVATSLSNLALLYRAQGRYTEAEPLYKRSIAVDEKTLAADDPARAVGLNNLAMLYLTQGRYPEAEPLLQQCVAILEKAPSHNLAGLATALNNLAGLYDSMGRYTDAERLYQRSITLREKALGPDHPELATGINNLASLYGSQGRYAEAESLYERSLQILENTAPEHPDVATTLTNLALLYDAEGRHAEAKPLHKRSLAIREKVLGPDHPDVAASLNSLAELYRSEGRNAEAESLYKRTLAIYERALGPNHPKLAIILGNLGLLYDDQGRFAEAEPLFQRSLAIREQALGPDHPDVGDSLNNLGALYVYQHRFSEAELLFSRGLSIYEKAWGPDHAKIVNMLGNLARLRREEGQIADALQLSRRAVSIVGRRLGAAAGRSYSAAAERREQRSLFLQNAALLSAAAEVDATGESFRVAQLASASVAAEAVSGMAVRFGAGNDALGAIVRERQDLIERWRQLDRAIIEASSKAAEQRDAATEQAWRRQLTEAGSKLDALDARLAREFPAYTELSNPKPIEIAKAQSLLGPDEAMLVYLIGDETSWLWAVRRDRAAFYPLAIGAKDLGSEVERLRDRLDPDSNSGLAPFGTKAAFDLYQKIVAPAAPLLDGAHQLVIVPDGALEGLPFDVLVTEPAATVPNTPEEHRSIRWLARSYAVDVLPSVGSLPALRLMPTAAAPAPFIGIGDPVLGGEIASSRSVRAGGLFRGPLADVAALRELPSLPETANELRAVAKALGAGESELYLRERASESLVRQAGLERYRVIEFATHGLMSGDLPGLAEPALVLTPPREATAGDDGLLTASEIATLKLNADWVVLSACNTAAADGTPDAGGLSGLAKAFFYAGARAILVSHWSVPSKATVKLVTNAFDELRQDPSIGRAEALRRAKMAMLGPSNPPEFAHPMFWAPFALAGEGGAGR